METLTRNQIVVKRILYAFISLWAIFIANGLTMRNVLTPAMFAALFLLYGKDRLQRRAGAALHTTALLYTGALLGARYGDYTARFSSGLFRGLSLAIVAAGMYLLFLYLLKAFVCGPRERAAKWLFVGTGARPKERWAAVLEKYMTPAACAVCAICYLPCFLYEYPGIMSPDSINQLEQVLHVQPWSNHHPAAHTAVIAIFYRMGYALSGSVNGGIAAYTLAQMLFLSLCCAVVVRTMRRLGVRLSVCCAALAFYALTPFMGIFSVSVWKDVPFSGITMLLSCVVVMLLHKGLTWKRGTAFVLLGVAFCLFRTNGWYAFLLFAPFLLLWLRRQWKRALPMILAVIGISVLVRGPVMACAGVAQPDLAESLSIPLQQIARVLTEGHRLTGEERDQIERVIDTTYIRELYDPCFADNMKELVRAGHPEYLSAHKAEYLRLWLRLGLRYPGAYLRGWADQTRGIFFPDLPYEVAEMDGVYPNDIGAYWAPKIGGMPVVKLREISRRLGDFVPLYGLLWSIGTYGWLLLLAMCLMLTRTTRTAKAGERTEPRRHPFLPAALLPAGLLLTLLLATPTAEEFRYALPAAATMPLWFTLSFYGGKDIQKPANRV